LPSCGFVGAATHVRAGASALMDFSDGLLFYFSRLCTESAVGARVQLASLPVAQGLSELAEIVKADPLELALSGGEVYELVATIDPAAVDPARSKLDERFGVPLADIGEITESGFTGVDAEGAERPLEPRGWDHFGAH